MKSLFIIIALAISSVFAQNTFTKTFNKVDKCEYDSDRDTYTLNCTSYYSINKFVFNYNNSTNMLWITSDGSKVPMLNLGKTNTTYNDDGDMVEVFTVMDNQGTVIPVVWAVDKWFKLVLPNVAVMQFSTQFN